MTPYLLDSGFLYALIDDRDVHHKSVLAARSVVSGWIVFPVPAITEVCYFVRYNLGTAALSGFLEDLSSTPDLFLEAPLPSDYNRSAEILRKYEDANIDFVDACVVAMAERLNIKKILTVDRRHFGLFRPAHCDAFEPLP